MADTKLSALTALAAEMADTDEIYVNDGGVSKRQAYSVLKANIVDSVEGSAILSTGETGGTKFLREDGDGTCSWQTVSGGAGDFKADGSVDMTGQFRTDVGTFASDVADGASAQGFRLKTTNTLSTAGADILTLSNNATDVFDFSFQGGIDHVNSGASTAAHSQSLNLNWLASGTQTSSGQYSAAIGLNNTASGARSFAAGGGSSATSDDSIAMGSGSVASASHALAIGRSNTSSNQSCVALGAFSTASGLWSLAFGYNAVATNRAEIAHGAVAFSTAGDAQSRMAVLKAATTNATQTTMQAGGGDYVIPADTSWVFSALVIGRSDEADGNDSAAYRIEGCLSRDESNNTAIVGSVTVTTIAESAGATAWDVTAEADDTNEALAIKVTGEAATNIRWVAKVDIAQVTFA